MVTRTRGAPPFQQRMVKRQKLRPVGANARKLETDPSAEPLASAYVRGLGWVQTARCPPPARKWFCITLLLSRTFPFPPYSRADVIQGSPDPDLLV